MDGYSTSSKHELFNYLNLAVLSCILFTFGCRGTDKKAKAKNADLTHWASVKAEPFQGLPQFLMTGVELYSKNCACCHGEDGDGKGPNAGKLANKPRSFAKGVFKFRTTSSEGFPSDLDFFRTITVGAPAYDKPSFPHLSEHDRWALVAYLKKLTSTAMQKSFETAWKKNERTADPEKITKLVADRMKPGKAISIPQEPKGNLQASIQRGRRLFIKSDYACANCHGPMGKGDGPNSATMKDEWGLFIPPRDLTKGERKYGGKPEDTVRLILIGIPGTPMPANELAGTFSAGVQEIWDIARYVEHLSKAGAGKAE